MVDKVVFEAEFARYVVCGDPDEAKWDGMEAESVDFYNSFEHLGNRFHADPDEDWYQGVDFMSVIRRKSDGALFGYPYWESIAKHGEPYYAPNGYEHEDVDDDAYAFLPVKSFPLTGYELA